MAIYVPRENSLNWYEHYQHFSLELLHEYVNGIEIQVAQSIKLYQDEKHITLKKHWPSRDYFHNVEVYRGLDDTQWNIKGIFEEFFPSLQRSSAFITLCGFIEYELDALCSLMAKEKEIKIKVANLQGKGIHRALKYLEMVIGLNIDKSGNTWAEVQDIQAIRNLVVHNGGILKEKDGKIRQKEIDIVIKSQFLSGNSQINFEEGYLTHVLNIFDDLYKIIDKPIRISYGF